MDQENLPGEKNINDQNSSSELDSTENAYLSNKLNDLYNSALNKSEEIDGIHNKVLTKSDEIDSYSKSIETKAKEVESLYNDSSIKSGQIDNFQNTSSAKSEQIDNFHTNSSAKSEQINSFHTNSSTKSEQINGFHANSSTKSEQINGFHANSSTKSGQIDGFHNNATTKSGQIDNILNTATLKSGEIENFYNNGNAKNIAINKIHDETNKNNSDISTYLKQFNNLKEEVENPETGLAATVSNSTALYNNIKSLEDSSSKSNGNIKQFEVSSKELKDKINKQHTDISEEIKQWEKNYKTLYEKIEGLLPGATSTGLAKAYQDQAKKYNWPYYIWASIFVSVMIVMTYIGLKYVKEVLELIKTVKRYPTFTETINLIIERLPVLIPVVWLAVFSSKQQSQNRRLREEYAYKETLSKSYESYRREVDNLKDSENKRVLIETLLKAMVEMSAYNPSHTLQSKEHQEKSPFAELLSPIISKNNQVPEQTLEGGKA